MLSTGKGPWRGWKWTLKSPFTGMNLCSVQGAAHAWQLEHAAHAAACTPRPAQALVSNSHACMCMPAGNQGGGGAGVPDGQRLVAAEEAGGRTGDAARHCGPSPQHHQTELEAASEASELWQTANGHHCPRTDTVVSFAGACFACASSCGGSVVRHSDRHVKPMVQPFHTLPHPRCGTSLLVSAAPAAFERPQYTIPCNKFLTAAWPPSTPALYPGSPQGHGQADERPAALITEQQLQSTPLNTVTPAPRA